MLAMQTSPNLDSQPQRPFSWYVAANRSPSEDAYQLGSAGTASPKTVQPPANTPKSLSDLDFDVLPLIDADDLDLSPRTPRNRQSTASTLLPPVLPAGFRNFSRYLDTKFGPDSSSVSLESIADPQGANEAGSGGPSNAAPTAEANVMAENTTVAKKEGHGRQQIKASCSPVATIADMASPNYYSDNIAKSWTNRSPLPVRTHAPRERRASAHGEADFLVQNRRQTAVTSPLTNENRIRTGSASPTSSYFSDWPQNENAPTSTPTYDFNVSCLPLPSHGLAWSDYRSRTYWSTPQFLPYAWNTVHTPPPPPPPPPLPPPTIPFFPSWFPFADYLAWCGPAGPYGPHPHAIPPYAQIPPLVPVLPHQRPTFNPAADWFRAAANHFAAAAMFADRQGQTDETVQSTAAASAAAFDNRRLAQTRRSADPAPRKSETSRIPAKIAPSASSASMRSKPQVAINGTLVSPEEPSPPGPPRRRLTEPSQDAPNSSRPAESPLMLSEATGSSEDNPWTGDLRERFFEDLELPQDPALILPDYLDFYARIKGLLELDCSIVLPLPPGWSMGVSTSGRRFYICDRTRNTTWQHPVVASRVPLGWERVEMGQGCVYYRHLLIPHAQRHHPDLWFPANLKNLDSERQGWFFELRKLQDSLSNFDKGISALIEAYADTMDAAEDAEFIPGFRQKNASDLNSLVQQLECRFFRDLHRIIVAYELARIRIVRQLLVRHNARPCSSAPCSPSPSSTKTVLLFV
nr:unnamed protein product [Spirometra erinaceieuropaei]